MNTSKNKDKWDSLSMKEKSDMMKVAVQQGIYSLSEIRKAYNEYAEGGPENNGNPRPVTTGGAGYIPPSPNFNFPRNIQEARLRLYNQISPSWGFTDDTIKAALSTLLYNRNAFNSNTEESSTENISIGDPYVESVWAEYLQIPEDKRRSNYRLEPSDYRPTVGDNTNDTYYKIPIDKYKKEDIVRTGLSLPLGKNKVSRVLESYNHGDATVGRGFDPNNGEYISYYDRWDLNPFSSRHTDVSIADSPIIKFLGLKDNRKYGDLSFGIGKPINFYDRIYLDDYYGTPKDRRGSYYLPEVTVTPDKKSTGGPLVQLANRYEDGGDTNEGTDIIDWIIDEEGFNTKPEDIGDGKTTLGSGLTNPKWHKMYYKKGTWTEEDNRAAVAEEVENRRRWAEQNVPNWTELPADSQNALLSYKYNYNFTPKNSPKLFQALKDRNYEEAARQMDATSSNPRFRKGLQARRQREQEMFMRGIDSMNASEPEVVKEVPQEESIYTPPQRVLDNMAAHNGKYMIMGNPPLAGVRNTVLDALRRLKALNLFAEGGPKSNPSGFNII